MPAPHVLAFRDAIDLAVEFIGGNASEKAARDARSAVQEAYRDLALCHDWRYLYRLTRVQLSAAYSTGTVAYNATTRALTLTGGTWPSWAAYGTVRVNSVNHMVQSRDSDSQLTLDVSNSPASNISAGATYTLFRSVYTLPSDFRGMLQPHPQDYVGMQYVPPDRWQQFERHWSSSGTPRCFTVMAEPGLVGSMALHVWPYPASASTLDFIYKRLPRQLVYSGYGRNETSDLTSSASTVATTANATTVTGTNTAFTADMVGSLLRVASSGETGIPDGREGGLQPFLEQKVIASYSSATSVSADSVFSNSLSGVKYCVTDPLDLHPRMLNAFKAGVRLATARTKNMKGVERFESDYQRALVICLESESDVDIERREGLWYGARAPYSVSSVVA